MTQEEKQLVLIDLCARFPYDIIVRVHDIKYGDFDSYIDSISNDCIETYPVEELTIDFNPCIFYKLQEIKPYLRSMSSMTEEETLEFGKTIIKTPDGYPIWTIDSYDWLNAHHFDYRGLIEKLLAIIAPEDMYKTE